MAENAVIEVSVIVPVYNSEQYIESVVLCILEQSEKQIEIILINDGSTDSSYEIICKMAKSDSRIVLINTKNGGLSRARNIGINAARGQWITFVDSDDFIDPETLTVWKNQAIRSGVEVLVGNGFKFESNYKNEVKIDLLKRQKWNTVMTGRDWIIHSTKVDELPHYAWLQFINRNFIESNCLRFTEGLIHEDILWTLNVALNANKIGFCQRSFYGYRQNPVSLLKNPSQSSIEARATSYITIICNIVLMAENQTDRLLKRTLLRQANRELGHLLGLIRKKIILKSLKKSLSKEFIDKKLFFLLFMSAVGIHEKWRVFRSWLVLSAIKLA